MRNRSNNNINIQYKCDFKSQSVYFKENLKGLLNVMPIGSHYLPKQILSYLFRFSNSTLNKSCNHAMSAKYIITLIT